MTTDSKATREFWAKIRREDREADAKGAGLTANQAEGIGTFDPSIPADRLAVVRARLHREVWELPTKSRYFDTDAMVTRDLINRQDVLDMIDELEA